MPLQAPNLDDRRFADIVAEAKTLIPRYAPEWTDHNESDPGITLVQLFAWMTDMLLYRLNQVPERSYIKFLQLLGIELKPAQPARAELTFTLARDDLETVIVPKGTQVAVADGGDDEPLVFETDEALTALGAKLKAVQSFDGFSYSVESTKNDATEQWYYPFGPHAREGSALLLGFGSPIDFTDEQINLTVYVFTAGLQAEGRHCDLDLTQMPVPATLVWEYWDRRHWQPLSLDKDETRAFTRSGHIHFRGPGNKLKKDRLGAVEEELYWIRCRLVRSPYEMAPRLETILTNTAHATQALTVRDEVVGGSDGRPNQTFRLANGPVVVRDRPEEVIGADGTRVRITSLRLEVDEGHGFEVWQEVPDFHASGPDDPHYVLNRTIGEIRFGDGQHGRIPVANPASPNANVVAREYRYGGGKRGNVGVETITELQTFAESVESVINRRPAYGGYDEETLAEAKLRAPREIKSKERAVTAEDFELLARETPGVRVRRAKALPLVHPKFPDAQIPGVVTVIIVPEGDAPNPTPSEATLSVVCAHLNKHRLLTSEVHVVPPTYRKVRIEAAIVARPEADLAEVKRGIDERLIQYFHPLKGGENGTGWEFGRHIFYSEVYREVLQVPGVDRVQDNELYIWLDNERQPYCRDVPIEPGVLLYSEGHDIRAAYSLRE
ncbi:MAG: putative baseplate assembly protein [Anaerolineae bacterium]